MRRRLSWRQICLLAGGSRPAAHSALPASARARRRLVSVSEVAHFDGSRSRGVARGERERERAIAARKKKLDTKPRERSAHRRYTRASERERERFAASPFQVAVASFRAKFACGACIRDQPYFATTTTVAGRGGERAPGERHVAIRSIRQKPCSSSSSSNPSGGERARPPVRPLTMAEMYCS